MRGSFRYLALSLANLAISGGGCVIPLPGNNATGTDCSAIPGVAAVLCEGGKCSIKSCDTRAGWRLSLEGDECLIDA